MRRYQQHTHASWHRAYADKFDCPWCQTPHRAESTTQNRNRKSAKNSDNGRTSRAIATSTPVGRRIEQHGSNFIDEAIGTPLPQTPGPAPHADEETSELEPDTNYPWHKGRTDGLNNGFASDTPRPPLPEEWTKEIADQEHGAAEWTPPAVEDWRSGLDTSADLRVPAGEKIGSPELTVKEVEESGERLG
ncbi:hypothetical protein N7491_004708 [Penicillium cf. griseofulvum]|uniref:Uncharacterized protein n=1 Tax=Penicillium cf. griseofulvum TaxID=2972120 RepID=A0A9W9J0I2_9EURO|nr:hypothetical protein N7472_007397 [Penicillium cf. griseofulvum]KAJ5434113.1 hypothetical protein N7491_004708 [Penicillium cf. griseofulvum]KAJ5451940.1 hypothetical protein N7445_000123 [Penicillium cf. griseofulvum]